MSGLAVPRWATSRSPDRPTVGNRVGAIAEMLGTPLMPWQQLVVDVAGEQVQNEGGLWVPAFRSVVFTVPRQSGKTTVVLGQELDRAINWDTPQHVVYTAQTGQDARSKLIKDQVPVLKKSRLNVAIRKVLQGSAYTAVEFHNGSRIEALATAEDAAHGRTVGLAVIDEAMSDYDDRREQGLLPAMLTVADAQLWVASTAGTDKSVYLKRKVDEGRDAVARNVTSGTAFFEWSAPDDADADDPDVWAACMPALGFTQTLDSVGHARQTMTDSEFRRAMLNQWTTSDERLIPLHIWEQVQDADAYAVNPVFAVDVPLDRSSAVIVASDGTNVEIVDRRTGTGWAVDRLVELVGTHGGMVYVDGSGPAASYVEQLTRLGVRCVALKLGELKVACSNFYDLVADNKLRVRPDSLLDDAVAGVVQRTVGDDWVWGRAKSEVDISPLFAATVAVAGGDYNDNAPPNFSW